MVKKLKQKIRENMEEKYNALYQKEWNEKKLGYEKWIREQQTFDKKSYQTLAFEMLKKKVSLIKMLLKKELKLWKKCLT